MVVEKYVHNWKERKKPSNLELFYIWKSLPTKKIFFFFKGAEIESGS